MAKINRAAEKNVVETMKEIMLQPNMECGIDEIEFPDGTKEKFYFNGEADRQAAITFATICVNATTDTAKAKQMMYTCFMLMVKGVKPERIVMLDNGVELYLDVKKKALYDASASEVVSLTEEEGKKKMSVDVLEMLLKERAERVMAEEDASYDGEYDYDCDDEKEDW